MNLACAHTVRLTFFTFILLAISWPTFSLSAQSTGSPPPTRRASVVDTIHGVTIVDHYRWLEGRRSAETRAWIDAQNEYTNSLLDLPMRNPIRARLAQLLEGDQIGIPTERNGYHFFSMKRADEDLFVIYRRKGLDGEDEVLIDPHSMSPDHTTSVGRRALSDDGRLLVYAVRYGGTDEVELRVLDVEAKTDLPDRFPNALYSSVSFPKDNRGFYYVRRTREEGGNVYFHELGTDVSGDREVWGGGFGPNVWIGARVSDDGRYLLLTAQHGWAKSEVYVKNIEAGWPVQTIIKDIKAKFSVDFAGDQLIMRTDWKAPNNRIVAVDLKQPAQENWREIVSESDAVMRGFSMIGGKLYVNYLHNVSTQIKIFDLDGNPTGKLPFPAHHSGGISGRSESSDAFVSVTSLTTPRTVYHYDVATGERQVWWRQNASFDSDKFEVKQIWYRSKDGTNVPMFIVHQKGLELDGNRPTLLYGYGGFNVSLRPRFDLTAAVWVEAGGVYALANLRGGGEFGEEWHRAGMLENKQNVFDDFIAAAEWLIENDYTNPDRLAIRGGSNGGLLVGAALTQRPELFQAVLCLFPDLDMVRYYTFTENNNPPALLEYGNAADPQQFKFLYAYSPYQNVRRGARYPAVLLTSGDADTRVPPLQARKMTAALQYATSSGRPILLRYDTKAGHAGGRPFSKVIDDLSMEIAFLMWQLGVDEAAAER